MDKARILVVEDEQIVARDLESGLTRMGYEVSGVASTGEDAVRQAAEAQPDLVLMDITLRGEMDGVEAAEQLRSRIDVPVVYVTAYADDTTLQRAKETEPAGYIIKPFEDGQVHAVIETTLYRHKRERLRQDAIRSHAEEALREGAERFRSLFDFSNDMIFLVDPEGNEIFDANPKAAERLGYSREELLAMSVSTVYPGQMSRLDDLARAVQEDGYAHTNGITCTTRSGQVLSTEISAAAFDLGGTRSIIAMVRDVTDRKRTEDDLDESNESLEQRVRELTALNALFREHLKDRHEAERMLLEARSTARGFLFRLQALAAEIQGDVEGQAELGPAENQPTVAKS